MGSTRSTFDQTTDDSLLGIVRRFLDALKAEPFASETFPHFMEAFKSLVECNMSAEVLRSLALYVTYALHGDRSLSTRTLPIKSSADQTRRRQNTSSIPASGTSTPTATSPQANGVGLLSRPQLALKVLEMFTGLLCGDTATSTIKKFARTVTNKVCTNCTVQPQGT